MEIVDGYRTFREDKNVRHRLEISKPFENVVKARAVPFRVRSPTLFLESADIKAVLSQVRKGWASSLGYKRLANIITVADDQGRMTLNLADCDRYGF